ncbi:GNAT family N-acetyltransferase [Neptuniibacter sp.]|uniref:GNAT family N-acetyltransferase n=1 Tax=Neptuniibacter sp. TaxID=1962643 RepID=UPI002612CFF8|nr:GNAT family N-acetyltransferase [Neptuniibacter sp.]MCP4597851.1 GNAT family N-acetyltransferase [Neptuniibacter sp.]
MSSSPDILISEVKAEGCERILCMWESLTLDLPSHHFQPFGKAIIDQRKPLLSEMLNNTVKSESAVVFQVEVLQAEMLQPEIKESACIGTISAVLNQQAGFENPISGVIFNLWIEPDYRRLGIASQLVEQAKRWLANKEATSVQVGWHPDNQAADHFWKKQGFRNYEVIAALPL